MAPVQLTFDLLDALAERWRAIGAPVADSLLPGIPDHDAAALTAPLGCSLPPEARTWWGWHNGTDGKTTAYAPWPGMWLVPLSMSVENSRWEWREYVGLSGSEAKAREFWRPTWLPILTTVGGDHIVIDCAEQDEVSPVYAFDRDAGGPWSFNPAAPSIGTMVTWWIEGIDAGACWWDDERRLLMSDHARLDPYNSRRNLV